MQMIRRRMALGTLLGLAGLAMESWAAPRPFLNCQPSHLSAAKPGRPAPLAKRAAADTVEKVKGLVILVDFPDKKGTVSRTEIDNMVNKPGYSGLYGNGSVRDYWLAASRGKLEYSATVTEYYTTLRKKSYYDSIAFDGDSEFFGSVEMFKEVLKGMDAKGFDFSPFTRDSQGRIRALTFLYVGAMDLDDTTGFGLSPMYLDEEGLPDGTALTLDGAKLSSHMVSCIDCFPEKEKAFSKNIGIHEMGHMLFLWPDLYGESMDINARGGLGNYCIMSLALVTAPPPPNPYLRILQGWETPLEISATTSAILSLPSNGRRTYRYPRPGKKAEFFLIEAVHKKGFWAGFPDEGLAIYRINEEADIFASESMVSILQADGRKDIEDFVNNGGPDDLFHAGHNAVFNSQSLPDSKWQDGQNSGLNISNISAVLDTMTFRVGSAVVGLARPENAAMQLDMLKSKLRLHLDAADNLEIKAISAEGRLHPIAKGYFRSGSHALDLAGLSRGVYLISVQGGKAGRMARLVTLR